MKRETNLMVGFGLTVLAAVVAGLFTNKDMFEAPGWNAVRPLMPDEPNEWLFWIGVGVLFAVSWSALSMRLLLKRTPRPTIPIVPEVRSLRPIIEELKIRTDLFPTVSALISLRAVVVSISNARPPVFSDNLRAEARSLLSELHKVGVPTPRLNGSHKKEMVLLRSYLDTVLPSLMSSNYELTRREAERWFEKMGQEGDR